MQYAPPRPPSSGISTPDPFGNAPPINLEAEQSILGYLLVWNDAIDDIAFLKTEHFYDNLHKTIFEAIGAAIRAGRKATPISLRDKFGSGDIVYNGQTAVQYLGTLASTLAAGSRAHLREHARTIVDLATRRQLILIGEDLIQTSRETPIDFPPNQLIEETETRLFSLAQDGAGDAGSAATFGEASDQFVKSAYAVADGKMRSLRTGLADLDAKLVGPQPTDFIVLAGRPGMGKTALAANIAFHVAASGQGAVDFYSLEMSAEQLAARVLAEQVGIASSKVWQGNASPAALAAMMAKAQELSAVPLHIDQTGGISIAQLAARARRRKRKHSTALIVIDYIQLMQAGRRRSNGSRVEDVSEITTGLKALAKELETPIVALSQLNRAVESRENKRPQLSDLRESGSIEQDADVVMFVFREEYYLEREQPALTDPSAYADWQGKMAKVAGKAEIIIGKQRHGELAIIPVAFSGELTKFSNLAREERRHA